LQKTQVALLKSWFVLNTAVRGPGIARLSILAGHDDPVAWLHDNLEVGFLDGSEIMSIRLQGTESEANDLKLLVDGVAKAYDKEVVYSEKMQRLMARDAKAKALDTLGKELAEKLADLQALKKELGAESADSPEVQLKQINVDVLTDVFRQLLRGLELDDIESSASPQIRQIQPAVVSPD
jgi:hypothetical protein